MKTTIFIATIAILLPFFFYLSDYNNNISNTQSTNTQTFGSQSSNQNNQQTTSNSNSLNINDPQIQPYAYLVSGDTLDQSTMNAISGFNVSKSTMPNGSVVMTVTDLSRQTSQSITLSQGQKMYFIETSFGDDSPPFGEFSLSDDSFVITDSQGYMLSG